MLVKLHDAPSNGDDDMVNRTKAAGRKAEAVCLR